MTRVLRRLCRVLAAVAVTGVLAGCSSTLSLTPAPGSDDPACAEVLVRVPDTVAGQSRRWTDAQATAAWGAPTGVILTCGVAEIGPTTLPCRSVDGVDWVIDDTEAPRYRVTTFGRSPAVEVYLDNDVVSSAEVLEALSGPAAELPRNGSACTTIDDAG